MIEFEERFGPMFPPDWEMSERISVQFCRVTRSELSKILGRRSHEVDTKLLLHAIQKTAAFETLLSRRFSGVTLQGEAGSSPAVAGQAAPAEPPGDDVHDLIPSRPRQPGRPAGF